MKSPKPAQKGKPKLNAAELTAKGKPRQRAPGAGRPDAGRKCRLSPVSTACRAHLDTIKAHLKLKTLADAIEHAARVALKKLKTTP